MQEKRITITLFDDELNALQELARIERRETCHQAAFVVRYGLHQLGLLDGEVSPIWQPHQPARDGQSTL
jgi:hypothetical protein